MPKFNYCHYGSLIHAPGAVYRKSETPYFLHVSFILSGSVTVRRGRESHLISSRQLFIAPGDTPFYWRYSPESETCEYYIDYYLRNPTSRQKQWRAQLPFMQTTSRKEEMIFEAILATERSPYGLTEESTMSKALIHLGSALLAVIQEESQAWRAPKISPTPYRRPVDRALSIIHNYSHQPLTLGKIAGQCGVSKEHLIRLFQAAGLPSPMQQLKKERLQNGLHLLRSTRLSVKEIAGRVGFKTTWYFCKAFKNTFGATPEKVRHAS